MRIDPYLHLVPELEQSIRDLKPDAIVYGMGPTAWLLPWIDQRLLKGVRLWTCHDGCRIMPAHELIIMDPPHRALHPDTSRYQKIVESRPERIWCIHTAWKNAHGPKWEAHLPESVKGITEVIRFHVWHPGIHPRAIQPELNRKHKKGIECLDQALPDTIAISPTGTTTLAWAAGHRRIGVLGTDMLRNHHHTYAKHPQVDQFFCSIAAQADAQGGVIRCLSPITSLQRFKTWRPSTSGSLPTHGNNGPEPKQSSSTASASTPSETSKSTGCAAETQASK